MRVKAFLATANYMVTKVKALPAEERSHEGMIAARAALLSMPPSFPVVAGKGWILQGMSQSKWTQTLAKRSNKIRAGVCGEGTESAAVLSVKQELQGRFPPIPSYLNMDIL